MSSSSVAGAMALPFGKLTILIGAGILGSVLAKEGRMPNVSDFISSAAKMALKPLKREDSTPLVGKPQNDSLLAQVNVLQQELRLLVSNRPITIVTSSGTGSNKYGVIIVVVVLGYGYVWWKGWKLPDMMFATRRSLSDACMSIGQQLESVYSSIRSTRRQLSSSIDRVDSDLSEVVELTTSTHAKVTELRDDSEKIGLDVRFVRDAVETLELKIGRIEGKQDLTNIGVKRLCDYASSLENSQREENIQASTSNSQITYSSKVGALPPPSEPSTPLASNRSGFIINDSREVQRQPGDAASVSGQQSASGILGTSTPSPGISEDTRTRKEAANDSSWFGARILSRVRGGTNNVLQRTSSSRQ